MKQYADLINSNFEMGSDYICEILSENNERYRELQKAYSDKLDSFDKAGRELLFEVQDLLYIVRAMHDYENKAFYGIGIQDGISASTMNIKDVVRDL